ncbi:DUF503 domain-containing protein [Candidatus Oleimmundimicrobium sp.]|uniref:DUF503 domain-containing protein n=1 Tax=Candidatus Oleimmundimicrobium sp. TaxID=3060597 RepID=UPI002722923C|nr:DUF503 domain-containing protein [Candidatus Oleimmundimicrobium sp.]MDO8885448.1 DUF503 domain-containing protein [Candidatus Oleimmundimicrobium sp.]
MILGLLELDLHIPESHSLKDKRSIVKSIISKIRNKYNVSVGEMEHQDLCQRALIGIVCVSQNEHDLRRIFGRIEQEVFDMYLVEKIQGKISVFSPDS